MGSWNFRVVRKKVIMGNEPPGQYFAIHEAYYDGEGKIEYLTQGEVTPYGEDVEDLMRELKNMLKAFDDPVLDGKDFGVDDDQ